MKTFVIAKDKIGQAWHWLITPTSSVKDTVRYQRARLLATLLVSLVPLGFTVTVWPALVNPADTVWRDQDFLAMSGGAGFWLIAYVLNRKGRYELATKLAVSVGSLVIFAAMLNDDNPHQINFLVIPVLLSSFLLSAPFTVALVTLDLAVMCFLPMLNSALTLTDIIVAPLTFTVISTTLILLGARHRDWLERDRRVKLAESEARYRDLFETTFEGIAICQGDVLVDANPGLAQMFGYTLPEIIGTSPLDLFTKGWCATVSQHIQKGTRRPIEVRGLRKDGSDLPVEIMTRTQTHRGHTVRVIAVHDITGRIQTQEALRRSLAEIENIQQITATLLSLETLPQVMQTVAQGIVTQLGYASVLVSRYHKEEKAFTGMALYPIPEQFERFLQFIGRPELKDAPTDFQVSYQRGANPLVDRVMDGEAVLTDAMADLFTPWIPRLAATTAQKLVGIKALIDLPMQIKGRTVGTIVAGVKQTEITPEQQRALERVAGQAAIAVENARLYEAERQRRAELTRSNALIAALSRAATRLEATRDTEQILQILGNELEHLDLGCFVILGDPDHHHLSIRYISIAPSIIAAAEKLAGLTLDEYQVPYDTGTITETIRNKQPIYIPDLTARTDNILSSIPKSLAMPILKLVGITPDTPVIYLPLTVEANVLGVLTVWGTALHPEDIPALSVFTNQVAVTLENARLYEQAQHEIAERARAEEQIKRSLEEKEALLQEIHHRVKNNLQVISSLLNLQSSRIEVPQARQVFRDSQNRIRSMALIHEKLYRSPDLSKIDLNEYIRNLGTYLFRAYGANARGVTLKVQADGVFMDIDTAMPCGLIVNELVSNALKHAFPDRLAGEIRITLGTNRDRLFILTVSDNGIGLPSELDIHNSNSLGLQLVQTLVQQLDGSIELDNQGGTTFKIMFAPPPKEINFD